MMTVGKFWFDKHVHAKVDAYNEALLALQHLREGLVTLFELQP